MTFSSRIRCIHSVTCRPTNAAPPSMVAPNHRTVRARSPACMDLTAYTIVRLDDNSTRVITVENTMLGENANGAGQVAEPCRRNV